MPKTSVPPCTCNFTWEEMDAATTPWHRYGCPQGAPTLPKEKRYSFVCVAPEVQGPGSTDDIYEALLFTCSYYGSHFDIWDNVMKEYIAPIGSLEEEVELRHYIKTRDWSWKEKLAWWSVQKVLGLLEKVDHLWPK